MFFLCFFASMSDRACLREILIQVKLFQVLKQSPFSLQRMMAAWCLFKVDWLRTFEHKWRAASLDPRSDRRITFYFVASSKFMILESTPLSTLGLWFLHVCILSRSCYAFLSSCSHILRVYASLGFQRILTQSCRDSIGYSLER